MKSSKGLFVLLGIFAALALSLTAVSALSFSQNPVAISTLTNLTILRITNDNVVQDINLTAIPNPGTTFTLNDSEISNLGASNTTSVEVRLISTNRSVDAGGTITLGKINITGSNMTSSVELLVKLTSPFCTSGEAGENLRITSDNLDINNEGEGKDKEWELLDTISVEVKVENTGKDSIDVDDVIVELVVIDSSGSDVTGDLDFTNKDEEKIELGSIDEDDDDTATFTFKVPADFDEGSYTVMVKAYSDDIGESSEGTTASEDIKVKADKDKDIIFDNIKVSLLPATCGSDISISARTYNIGAASTEDQIRVNLVSRELGISQSSPIIRNLDRGDYDEVSFDFTLPNNLQNKIYTLFLNADYDYSDGDYDKQTDDTGISLQVVGCSATPVIQRIAAITLTSDAKATAGKPLEISANIQNLGSNRTTFVVSADGYQSWASDVEISDKLLTLDAGSSKEITLTFNTDKTATGSKEFTLEVLSGNKSESKTIEVSIAKPAGFNFNLGSNSAIWIIGIINVILIILIIVVAIRVSRK